MTNSGKTTVSNANNNGSTDGYTLLELLVVLGIITALTALVGPQLIRYLGQAKGDAARTQLSNLQSATELYYLDVGQYPTTQQGLSALVDEPEGVAGWRGPYLKKKSGLTDPWGKPFLYKQPGEHGEYDILSLGKDGLEGGEAENKDVVSW